MTLSTSSTGCSGRGAAQRRQLAAAHAVSGLADPAAAGQLAAGVQQGCVPAPAEGRFRTLTRWPPRSVRRGPPGAAPSPLGAFSVRAVRSGPFYGGWPPHRRNGRRPVGRGARKRPNGRSVLDVGGGPGVLRVGLRAAGCPTSGWNRPREMHAGPAGEPGRAPLCGPPEPRCRSPTTAWTSACPPRRRTRRDPWRLCKRDAGSPDQAGLAVLSYTSGWAVRRARDGLTHYWAGPGRRPVRPQARPPAQERLRSSYSRCHGRTTGCVAKHGGWSPLSPATTRMGLAVVTVPGVREFLVSKWCWCCVLVKRALEQVLVGPTRGCRYMTRARH